MGKKIEYENIFIILVMLGILSYTPTLLADSGNTIFSVSDLNDEEVSLKKSGTALIETREGEEGEDRGIHVVINRGSSLYIAKNIEKTVNGKAITFRINVSGVNRDESDYRLNEARYPFFIQLIFDSTHTGISLKERIVLGFKAISETKVCTKENIIYAFSNRMPEDSLINPHEGCSVISIGDDGETGQTLEVVRNLDEDYRYSFGSELKSPLKEVVIGFEGGEKLEKEISIDLGEIRLVEKGGQ